MQLSITSESFLLLEPFVISRGSRTHAEVVTVRLRDGDVEGWGECTPYPRYGETAESVTETIRSIESDLANGLDREALQQRLPSGAARNAVDCALWDFESKKNNRRAFELAGLSPPVPLMTAYTLSLGSPSEMQSKTGENRNRPLLKVKLGGDSETDIARLRSVRSATSADIIVDANEGWSLDDYLRLAPIFLELGVKMVEQPFPSDDDDALLTAERVLPVCADESCHDCSDLEGLNRRYDMVNIKLDKTGGLTEALLLRDEARRLGFGVMVGCMIGTSLGMAPAVLVGQGADFVDLDAPLLLSEDRDCPLHYDERVYPSEPNLWG